MEYSHSKICNKTITEHELDKIISLFSKQSFVWREWNFNGFGKKSLGEIVYILKIKPIFHVVVALIVGYSQ